MGLSSSGAPRANLLLLPTVYAGTMNRDSNDALRGVTVHDARALVAEARGILVDARDRRLYDNAHATGAISLPLSEIEAARGHITPDSVPPDRLLILYCA